MESSLTNSLAPNSRGNKPLPLSFYLQPCLTVARALLGKVLIRRIDGHVLKVRLTEVEAYLGDDDPASHAYRRRTARNEVMFAEGGACYVYLSYGMNFCMNVVCGPRDLAHAVLIRAAEPLEGLAEMRRRRGLPANADARKLCSGPGKLAQALGIDLADNGSRFDRRDLQLVDTGFVPAQISEGPRIGISKAVDFAYRFCVQPSRWLSRKA